MLNLSFQSSCLLRLDGLFFGDEFASSPVEVVAVTAVVPDDAVDAVVADDTSVFGFSSSPDEILSNIGQLSRI
jgi:hypothetical protein